MKCNDNNEAVFYNLYPCNSKPTSIIATLCLVSVVALSILSVVAEKYYHYPLTNSSSLNALAIGLFSALLLTPLAIMLCKKRSFEERYPLPADTVKKVDFPLIQGGNDRIQIALKQFDWLIQERRVEDFTDAIEKYEPDTFYDLFFLTFVNHNNSLFDRIIAISDRKAKKELVRMCLEKIDDKQLFSTPYIASLLNVTDTNKSLIELILIKADIATETSLVNMAHQQDKKVWVEVVRELRRPFY